ncbi:MAG: cation:proton antiporter [Sulfolobaceae archaeon]|nr:cation:proton antiporter [Sulfolobaceae archaeon]
MDTNTILTLMLVFATITGLILRRFGISPVLAYLISGILGESLGLNYNNPEFQFISFLATNLLSFEMGMSVNLLDLKTIFKRASIIVLLEFSIVFMFANLLALFLRLSILEILLLTVVGFDTSTSIAFKLSEKSLDPNDFKLIISVSSLEDALAFIALSYITSSQTNILNLILTSLVSLIIGYLISKMLITPTLKYGDESIILSSVASVFIFNILSQIVNLPSSLENFLLGVGASYALKNPEKVISLIRPLVDFTLIFFFFIAGSYVKISGFAIYYTLLSIILIFAKYIAFSIGYWFSLGDFIRAFRTGLFMTPLSEFGIVISLTALQNGLPVLPVYNISTILVAVSSAVASIITNKQRRLLKMMSLIYNKFNVSKIDLIIHKTMNLTIKTPDLFKALLRFILLSVIATTTPIILIELLLTFSKLFALLIISLIILIPLIEYILMDSTLKRIPDNEYKFVISFLLFLIFFLVTIDYEITIIKIISSISLEVIITSLAISLLVIILFFNKIREIISDIDKMF